MGSSSYLKPQAFGSFGRQLGTGTVLTLPESVLAVLAVVCVVAKKPVRARVTVRARTRFFMRVYSLVVGPESSFRWTSVLQQT